MPDKNDRPNPTTIRPTKRMNDLITAIREKTGMTFTQVIMQAVECLAEKLQITI